MKAKLIMGGVVVAAVVVAGLLMKYGAEADIPFLRDARDGFDS